MIWNPNDRDSMKAAFPNISKLLARVVVLPATSALVECMYNFCTEAAVVRRTVV